MQSNCKNTNVQDSLAACMTTCAERKSGSFNSTVRVINGTQTITAYSFTTFVTLPNTHVTYTFHGFRVPGTNCSPCPGTFPISGTAFSDGRRVLSGSGIYNVPTSNGATQECTLTVHFTGTATVATGIHLRDNAATLTCGSTTSTVVARLDSAYPTNVVTVCE
uniref:Uncharacterized protein n=1 Tax=Acrobeloides nanus TaxID=290746 RepID=A0A914E888_9BILA